MKTNKTKALEVWKTPTTKTDVQSFLRLVSYYRRFKEDCSRLAKPMNELKENVPFIWNNNASEAFEKLKKYVTSAPVLRQFDAKRKIYVTTDACRLGIGPVME